MLFRNVEKHRLFLLDIVRVICALLIYGNHSINMYGCTYNAMLDKVICSFTSPVMTCFFMVSGFSLYYQNRDKDVTGDYLWKFYEKRLITLYPSYLISHILFLLFFSDKMNDWLILTPVELLGIQSFYNTLFGILHNGGTWFVSCMLFCYFVYPILQRGLISISRKWRIVFVLICFFVIIYSGVIVSRYGLAGNYSNPFFRLLEFCIGVGVCSLIYEGNKDEEKSQNDNQGGWIVLCTLITIYVLIAIFLRVVYNVGMVTILTGYMSPIPLIMILLLLSSLVRSNKFENSRVLKLLSGITYQFYLMQLFLWKATQMVLDAFGLSGNKFKILVSFVICTSGAFLIYYTDKGIVRLIHRWKGKASA